MTDNEIKILIAVGVGIVVGFHFLGAFVDWLRRVI